MDKSEIEKMLEKQLGLLSERSRNRSCTTQDLVDMSLAMAEIAKVIQYPIFVQEASQLKKSLP